MKTIDNRKNKNVFKFKQLKIGDVFQVKHITDDNLIFMKISDYYKDDKLNSIYLGGKLCGNRCIIDDTDEVIKLETTLIIDS